MLFDQVTLYYTQQLNVNCNWQVLELNKKYREMIAEEVPPMKI